MSLCRRSYIDRRKEFSEEERDRLTKIDNEIWEKAKDSKLFFKVYPLVGKPSYQIKNNASINSIYNFVSEINKKYDKKVVKLSKRTEFKKEILSVNVMPLSRETIRELYIQNLQAKNQQMIDARRSGIDYSEDYLFQESDTIEQKNDLKDLGLEQRLFSESKDTTSLEILNKIANSDHNLASLAAHLIPYAKYVNAKVSLVEDIKPGSIAKNPNGSYNPITGNIVIKRTANFTSARAEATILHEIIHSLTYYELEKDTEENAYFTELFNHANLYLGALNLYGLSSKDEFMTAIFTNASFVMHLQNVPSLNKKKYKNLFEELFDKILGLLRITKSSPFYEEAFSTATNIIENFKQSAIEQENYEEYLKSSAYEKNYLYSEEEPTIKPGVEELFESDSNLANQVYEALGFNKQINEITDTKSNIERLKERLPKTISLTTPQDFADYGYTLKTNYATEIGTILRSFANNSISDEEFSDRLLGIIEEQDLTSEERVDKMKVFELKSLALTIKYRRLILSNKENILKNILKKQSSKKFELRKVNDREDSFIIDTDYGGSGIGFNVKTNEIWENDSKSILNTNSNQITPQQKQQALQAYSQYLDTTNNPSIEGFKKFVDESTQTVESYRAQEQKELSQRIPNIENYKVNGKVDKSLITDENDLEIYNEIYDKYDALITPLLNDNPELTNFIKNLSDFKRVVGKKTVRLVLKNVGESVSYNVITKRKNKTDDTLVYVLSELQKNKSGKIEAEDSKFKNAGVYAYLDFIINNQDKEIVVDNVITSKGMTVLKKLEKLGVVTATKAELEGVMRSPVKNKDNDIYFYKSAPFEYNKAFLINQSKISLTNPNKILEDKIKENALFSFLKQFDFDVKAFNSEYGYTNKETLDILNRVLYVDINNFENDFKNQFVDFLQFFLKYDSEYNNLLKRYTKEEIKNSFLKNLKVENKKINAFKKLIDKVLDALRLKKDYLNYYTTDIINRIYNNDATVLNYYKGLRPGSTSLSTLSSYDKNIVKDPQAEEIINAFADEFSLTGSIVLGEQGTTYTSDNNPFHDIDYQASGKTKEEIEEIVYKKFPNAQFFRSIPNEDYTTYTYIVPTGNYKIENLDIRAKEKNGKIYKDVYGYDVVDKDGKVVGTYRMEKKKTGKMTIFGNEEKKKDEDERGVKAKIVDFFQSDTEKQYFVKTYKEKNIKMAFWTDIIKAKLEYLRPKDIHDILLFNKEKLPQELKKQTNDTKNKIAINKLFKSLPILSTMGTEEQYLRHFNSVYSDTSVPIVVYRAVKHEGSELKDKSFFTDDPEYAIKYGDILKPYKLNILNPYTSTKVGIHRASIGSMLEDPMVDGIIGKESLNNVSMRAVTIELQEAQEEGRYLSTEGAIRRLAGPLTDTNSFVTTNVNQVYELGTEIDVDNFKEFVRNDLGTKELNKKSVSLYSKIFDVSEDEINEHLKNCG